MFRKGERKAPTIFPAVFTMNCKFIQLDVLHVPNHKVMQLVRIVSIGLIHKWCICSNLCLKSLHECFKHKLKIHLYVLTLVCYAANKFRAVSDLVHKS